MRPLKAAKAWHPKTLVPAITHALHHGGRLAWTRVAAPATMGAAPPPSNPPSCRMSIESLACPYCNALVPGADGAAVGQRVACPSCGEGFALTRSTADSSPHLQEAAGGGTAVVAVRREVDQRPPDGRHKWLVAGIMVGAMIAVAGLALAYALWTQPVRRDHDQPPMQEALRRLPPDCTVIAGVRVAELNRSEAGRDLMTHLFRVGKVDFNADMLQRWTGLNLGDIDLFVVGVRAEDGLVPRTVVVVRTLRPYDAEAVKKTLGAEPAVAASGKALFRGRPQELGLRPVVWFADSRTLVLGALEKHLDAVPDQPAENLDALPPAVKEALNQRVDVGDLVWVVGHSDDWRKTAASLLLGALPPKDAELLGRVRSFAVQMEEPGPGGESQLAVKCDADVAAQALEERLTAAKPAGADWKTDREGPWLTVRMKGDPFQVFKDLAK